MATAFEVNFDGLVGPTHNYSGLSHGNIASTGHFASDSNPLEAVLQGLSKMKSLADLGLRQGVFPPQERPDIETLRRLGFSGSDKKIIEESAKSAFNLLASVTSASSMWAANAATVSPSADTRDKKVHFTPANLVSKFHRSIEAGTTAAILKKIFKNPKYFVHHEALNGGASLGDEGAANHTRLCSEYGAKGVEFFVYGRQGLRSQGPEPKNFPARQTFEASSAIARLHGLKPEATLFAQQNPAAIDAGVFHNDVVGVGNQNIYLYHEDAYVNGREVIEEMRQKFQFHCGTDFHAIKVANNKVSLTDAVKSYLFNSQLVTLKSGHMLLVAPAECGETPSVKEFIQELVNRTDQPIREVRYFDLRQSMSNGGGPACLRLRVVLNEKEFAAVNSKCLMTERLYTRLCLWAKKHYRDRLSLDDLRDPALLRENRAALDDLTGILGLGSLYSFQKN